MAACLPALLGSGGREVLLDLPTYRLASHLAMILSSSWCSLSSSPWHFNSHSLPSPTPHVTPPPSACLCGQSVSGRVVPLIGSNLKEFRSLSELWVLLSSHSTSCSVSCWTNHDPPHNMRVRGRSGGE